MGGLRRLKRRMAKGPEAPHVMWAMPMYRYPHADTMMCWLQAMHDYKLKHPEAEVAIRMPRGTGIFKARALCTEQFLEVKPLGVLAMVDDDMTFPPEALDRLATSPYDITAGVGFSRKLPMKCYAADEVAGGLGRLVRDDSLWQPECKPVRKDFVGFGMVAIKRHVIEKMVDTYGSIEAIYRPSTTWAKNTATATVLRQWLGDFRVGKVTIDDAIPDLIGTVDSLQHQAEMFWEDWSFCSRARACGFEVWVDPSFDLRHIGDYHYGLNDWLALLRQEPRKEAADGRSA